MRVPPRVSKPFLVHLRNEMPLTLAHQQGHEAKRHDRQRNGYASGHPGAEPDLDHAVSLPLGSTPK
jgi:hypothetical protein